MLKKGRLTSACPFYIKATNNVFSDEDKLRFLNEKNVWFSSVKTNLSPHLVPLSFVYVDSFFYLCTPATTQKIKNLQGNQRVALSLEDAINVLICEGTADILEPPFDSQVLAAFQAKYSWNLERTPKYNRLIRVTPLKVMKYQDSRS